jgi:hypothetical protein
MALQEDLKPREIEVLRLMAVYLQSGISFALK